MDDGHRLKKYSGKETRVHRSLYETATVNKLTVRQTDSKLLLEWNRHPRVYRLCICILLPWNPDSGKFLPVSKVSMQITIFSSLAKT